MFKHVNVNYELMNYEHKSKCLISNVILKMLYMQLREQINKCEYNI